MGKEGKIFESDIETSSKEQNVFYFRVRDVNLPPDVRMRVKLPQNKYDCLLFYNGYLFPVEMKSTKGKSVSFSESIIKANQIENLKEATDYEDVIAGFLFNFREPDNKTYFVHIDEFLKYKNIAENQLDHTYINKINKSSIPIKICEEIGIEIKSVKKRVRYRYLIKDGLDKLIEDYRL